MSDQSRIRDARGHGGSPQIGREYYINFCNNWRDISDISLFGGVTNFSNILEVGFGQVQDSPIDPDEDLIEFYQNDQGTHGSNPLYSEDASEIINNNQSQGSGDSQKSTSSLTNDIFPNVNLKEFFYFEGRRISKWKKWGRNAANGSAPWEENEQGAKGRDSSKSAENVDIHKQKTPWYCRSGKVANVAQVTTPRESHDVENVPDVVPQVPTVGPNTEADIGINSKDQSTDFPSYIYNEYINVSARRKIAVIASLLVVLIFCVSIGALVLVFGPGIKQNETDAEEAVISKSNMFGSLKTLPPTSSALVLPQGSAPPTPSTASLMLRQSEDQTATTSSTLNPSFPPTFSPDSIAVSSPTPNHVVSTGILQSTAPTNVASSSTLSPTTRSTSNQTNAPTLQPTSSYPTTSHPSTSEPSAKPATLEPTLLQTLEPSPEPTELPEYI